jgi:exopolyphosphatase/guanosine-5'-triphosphate,3'-diphosphate pyrophosphatase
VRCACIDIGSNTTRLLVADCDHGRLVEVHQDRAFTHVRRGMERDGTIATSKLDEVAAIVCDQFRQAEALGALEVLGVATAAIRRAGNAAALVAAVRSSCGLNVEVLAEQEEARLAFVGAARTLSHEPAGRLGVVDVGGGSSELVVGTAPDRINWSTSFELGSGDLADVYLTSDPPSAAEISTARAAVQRALNEVEVPVPNEAVAVGGSAASLRRITGPLLDAEVFVRSLGLLCADRAAVVARRFALDLERVRLLPAGLLILEAVSQLFGVALQVGSGGLREGVLLERSGPLTAEGVSPTQA